MRYPPVLVINGDLFAMMRHISLRHCATAKAACGLMQVNAPSP